MSIFDKENFSQDFSQQILPIYAFPQLFPEPTTLTNTLATNSIANLTTDQKRTLLFNVQQPFEVPMKNTRKQDIPSEKRRKTKVRTANLCFAKIKISRFVAEQKVCIERFQDSPDHTHNIEESDKLKRSQAVRVLVEKEAVKNYPVPAIVNAVKEFGTEKLNLGMSVKELKWREVANIKYKIHGSQNTYLVGASKLTTDIQDTILFLKKEGYQVELYETHHQSTRDSTHKTNKYDWRLFTLYIRDRYGCWDVGAHFFVSKEDSDTVAEALIITRRFCSSWKPRYFLADQSSIEAKSIVTAFPGLQKAMHKQTKIGCEMLVQESINDCALLPIKRYISRYYLKNIHQWALWARQHFPLLLQVTSTNALESYHSELKKMTSSQHGLIGVCNKIIALDLKRRSDSDYVAFEFRVKKISVTVNEILFVNDRIEKGKELPGLTSLECHCTFFHKYMLPCKHIFHEQLYGPRKLLTIDAWNQFQQMFDESGFEIYEHRELVSFEIREIDEINKAAENRKLTVSELMERILEYRREW
ncbi:hypothetical protein Glove_481g50 [Diversispora epigaea]|uniref:ZSWIM1/3 RNaseH-like domain-containing protein n=1 Tax=Diversispora epigaea TaxID=1348612 RepID=A0A397GP10_9GLOM|nr:hypothetical protein Glove_481g50 [Diversispora epigaea]